MSANLLHEFSGSMFYDKGTKKFGRATFSQASGEYRIVWNNYEEDFEYISHARIRFYITHNTFFELKNATPESELAFKIKHTGH